MKKRGINRNPRTRELMALLGKLLSIVILLLLIWEIYVFFTSTIPSYFLIRNLRDAILTLIIFYTPLFYFVWSRGKDPLFRIWGKIASPLMVVLLLSSVIYGLLGGSLFDIISVPYFISNIVLVFVLGYFSWFDKAKIESKKPERKVKRKSRKKRKKKSS